MKTKGTITVFLSLTLTIILSLFCASLLSVRIACERSVCANAADQAVFSLLSEYDRDLLARYHVLFVDTGFSSGSQDYAACIHFLEDAADYILHPDKGALLSSGSGPWDLKLEQCRLSAATCASQSDGCVFAMQAVSYMKDTAAIGIVSALAESMQAGTASSYMNSGRATESVDLKEGMRSVKKEAREIREAQAAQAAAEAEAAGVEVEIVPDPVPEDFENPVDTISDLKKSSILSLVLPGGSELSGKTADLSAAPSSRTLAQSFGLCCVKPLSVTDQLLFREYLLTHCGSFREPSESSLSYELEYILCGKESDKENLETLAKELVLMRTGANAAAIYADGTLHARVSAASLEIATALASPELQPAIEPLLAAGLAWCEAVTDVRAMLSGKHVPVMKNAATWQVNAADVPLLLSAPDSLCRDVQGGLTYEGYLRVLLALRKQETSQKRLLDVVESAVRTMCGRPAFRIDLCIDTVEAEYTVLAEKRLTLTATRRASFREEDL